MFDWSYSGIRVRKICHKSFLRDFLDHWNVRFTLIINTHQISRFYHAMNAKVKWFLKFIPYISSSKIRSIKHALYIVYSLVWKTNKQKSGYPTELSQSWHASCILQGSAMSNASSFVKEKERSNDFIQAKCSAVNLCKCSLTSSHGLVFHLGHSFRLHPVLAFGFVISLQLKSLSLHSTDRTLIPAPQVTEHCKRQQPTIMKTKTLHKKERQKLSKTAPPIRNY